MFWSIDGTEWDYPCTIERVSEVRSSSISGQMLDGSYFNDVLGQFLKYTVTIVVPRGSESDYSTIYELLAGPVSTHTFVFPYNDTFITITGMVRNIKDRFILEGGVKLWRGTQFEVIATQPKRATDYAQIVGGTE